MPKDKGPSLPSLSKILKLSQQCLELYETNSEIPKQMRLLQKHLRLVAGTLSALQSTLEGLESDLSPDLLAVLADLENDVQKITKKLNQWSQEHEAKHPVAQAVPMIKPFLTSMGPAAGLYVAMLPFGWPHGVLFLVLIAFFLYLRVHPTLMGDLRDSWEDKDSERVQKWTETLERAHRNIQHFLMVQHQMRDSRRYDVSKILDKDREARTFWIANFGAEHYSVDTSHFIQTLLFSAGIPMSVSDSVRKVIYQTIQHIVDSNNDGDVTPIEFQTFLEYFGPLSVAGKRILEGLIDFNSKPISVHRWFSWRSMDRSESVQCLPPVPGTFLIRCSSQAGKFACDYVKADGSLQHSIIINEKEIGYHFENISTYFPNLAALVQHYQSRLKFPYLDPTQSIKFNVSGKLFECKLSLFLPFPQTKLCKLLTQYQRMDNAPIFYDKDPDIFNIILNFYRYSRVCMPFFIDKEMLLKEISFFELPINESDIIINGADEVKMGERDEKKSAGRDEDESYSPPSMNDSDEEKGEVKESATEKERAIEKMRVDLLSLPLSIPPSGPYANHEAVKAAMQRVHQQKVRMEQKEAARPPIVRAVSEESYSSPQHDLPPEENEEAPAVTRHESALRTTHGQPSSYATFNPNDFDEELNEERGNGKAFSKGFKVKETANHKEVKKGSKKGSGSVPLATSPSRSSLPSFPLDHPNKTNSTASTSSTSSSRSSSHTIEPHRSSSSDLPHSPPNSLSVPTSRGLSSDTLQANLNKAIALSSPTSSQHTVYMVPSSSPPLAATNSFAPGDGSNYRSHGITADDFTEEVPKIQNESTPFINHLQVESLITAAVKEHDSMVSKDKIEEPRRLPAYLMMTADEFDKGQKSPNAEVTPTPFPAPLNLAKSSSNRNEPSPSESTTSPLQSIDHVQLSIPPNGEEKARPFYSGILKLTEVPKPPNMAARGGSWYENEKVKVHLGVESDFRPNKKAHPAFVVDDLDTLCKKAVAEGYEVVSDEEMKGVERAFVFDPFGNRIEVIQKERSAVSSSAVASALPVVSPPLVMAKGDSQSVYNVMLDTAPSFASPPSSTVSSSPSDVSTSISVESFPFWKGSISRQSCESLLKPLPPGRFLFRVCSDAAEFIDGKPNPNLFVLCFFKEGGGQMMNTKIYRHHETLSSHKPPKEGEAGQPPHVVHKSIKALVTSIIGQHALGVD